MTLPLRKREIYLHFTQLNSMRTNCVLFVLCPSHTKQNERACPCYSKGCHRCLVIYEKHKNVLQYKESECEGDNMYMDQSNPAALPVQQMRSVLKSDHRGGAHPNTNNGHSRQSSSDQYSMRSNDDNNDCSKHQFDYIYIYI